MAKILWRTTLGFWLRTEVYPSGTMRMFEGKSYAFCLSSGIDGSPKATIK
ncbi:MAG: hypothetical protein L6420_09745 [Elusimicrobia bacterium]|nr:hypothetical protein [Elusimicrobiota bacterium]